MHMMDKVSCWAHWAACVGSAVGIVGWTSNARPARLCVNRVPALAKKEFALDKLIVTRLLELVEPLVALSISHLTATTRQKLANDDLSVNVYPNDYGGFVYVGAPPYTVPAETDMAMIFEAARLAGIVWLKFDSDAAIVDGLPIFEDTDPL